MQIKNNKIYQKTKWYGAEEPTTDNFYKIGEKKHMLAYALKIAKRSKPTAVLRTHQRTLTVIITDKCLWRSSVVKQCHIEMIAHAIPTFSMLMYMVVHKIIEKSNFR